jgi:hypothetical protein
MPKINSEYLETIARQREIRHQLATLQGDVGSPDYTKTLHSLSSTLREISEKNRQIAASIVAHSRARH